MAMDFPTGVSVGTIVTQGGNQYVWDGVAWNILPQQAPAMLSDLPPANPAVGQFWWRGTNGQLYIYVNDGNSSQWVQASGPATLAGAWEKITDLVFSASTGFSITDLGAFRKLRYSGNAVNSVASFLALQFSLDNGGSFQTGAAAYSYQSLTSTGTTVASSAATSNAWQFDGTNDAGANFKKAFQGQIEDFNSAGFASGNSQGGVFLSSVPKTINNYQRSSFAGPCNALRVITSSGNFSGSFTLEGVRG